MAKRWPKSFRERVLAWIDADPTRGPSDAMRHFAEEAMALMDKPLPHATIAAWVDKARNGTKPSNTAEAQRERRQRKRLELIQGGRESGSMQDDPQASTAVQIDGLDPDLLDPNPAVAQMAYLRSLGRDLIDARRGRQGNVVAKLQAMIHEAKQELDEIRREQADQSGLLSSMPEEEYLRRLREVAADTPDPYLEVYVSEYTRRHKVRLVR